MPVRLLLAILAIILVKSSLVHARTAMILCLLIIFHYRIFRYSDLIKVVTSKSKVHYYFFVINNN